jgi:di/tricarboxylate transporter
MITDVLLLAATFVALVSGRVSMQAAFMGFILGAVFLHRLPFRDVLTLLSDPTIITVVCFVVFARVLTQLYWLKVLVFGSGRRPIRAMLARFLAAVGAVSSVMPNTAVVGTFMGPATRHPTASGYQLLLPLSYMALAGGMMTQFGTSANLVVVGQAEKAGIHLNALQFFLPGLAVYAAVLLALVVFAPIVLRTNVQSRNRDAEFFHIEARVLSGSPLIGKSIVDNKLRNLDHFFVAEIIRNDRVISPVRPTELLREGDVLILVGDVRFMAELQMIDGLSTELSSRPARGDTIYHAVVGSNSTLIGATLKSVGFRSRFDASVLAIRRGWDRLSGKLGEIEIRGGDLLVVSAGPDFFSRGFVQPNLHVLEVEEPGQRPMSSRESLAVLAVFFVMIGLAMADFIDLAFATFMLVVLAFAFGWLQGRDVRRTFPFDLVILLWGSLALGMLIDRSGLDEIIAGWILRATQGQSPILVLITLFALTWALTEMLSNNSAALAALPIAMELSRRLAMPPDPFILTVAFGASASFLIPFGYQTHLMVLSPGGYRLKEFLSLGSIVLAGYAIAALTVISLMYLR